MRRISKGTEERPIYVFRPLVNTEEFISWARDQGFENVSSPEDLHVTVLYSKKPMDWSRLSPEKGNLTVRGGTRKVTPLGDEGAVVLKFSSPDLAKRHEHFVDQGGSHDYPSYQTHVTITYDGGDVDLESIEPFDGELVFGPEEFEVIDKEWEPDKEGAPKTSRMSGLKRYIQGRVRQALRERL